MKSLDSTCIIKVVDKLSKEVIGNCSFKLNEFKDQINTEKEFKLNLLSSPTPSGQIKTRIRVFWSKLTFFQNQILVSEKKMEMAYKEISNVQNYIGLLEKPFGIITYGEIENIFNNDVLEVPKDKEDLVNKKRMSVLPTGFNIRSNFSVANTIEKVIKSTIRRDVEWSGVSVFFLYLLIFLSCLQMQERSDFTGLIIGIIVFVVFIRKSKMWDTDEIMKLINGMALAAAYDFIWLVFHYKVIFLFQGYWNDGMSDKAFKKFVFILAILNFVNKFILILCLYLNINKEKNRKEASRKTVSKFEKYDPEKARKSVSGFFKKENPFK